MAVAARKEAASVSASRWALGPGAVAAGRDITGPVTLVTGGVDDPLAAALPSQALMTVLARRLDLARFTGRDVLISEVDAAVTGSGHGYVVIQGEAGVGKTALAAHLVWNRPCAYHFTWLPGGRSPENARRTLAAQLILGWNLQDQLLAPGGRFPGRCDDPAWLVDILHAVAYQRNRTYADLPIRPPVVLIVDGLDEAEQATQGRETGIPLGLPRPEYLPDGVFLILTTRFGVRMAGARDPGTVWRTIAVDGPDNLADMRRYLADGVTGDKPDQILRRAVLDHRCDPERFVETFARRCGGVWIYLRYMIDDIHSGRCSPADIATMPTRLVGYYLNQIQRWQELTTDWESVGRALLATLVVLQKPVSADDLIMFADVKDAVGSQTWLTDRLRPFLDTGRDGYAVRHQSLRDLFTAGPTTVPLGSRNRGPGRGDYAGDEHDHLVIEELIQALASAHRRIFQHLSGLLSNPRSSVADAIYAREHLPRHAAGANLFSDLLVDPSLVLACDPAALLRQRAAATTREASAAFSAFELSREQRMAYPEEARWWLHVWARKIRADELASRCLPTGATSIRYAWWIGRSHLQLIGHEGGVSGVCAVALPDGTRLLASAGGDGTVRLWDPTGGQPIGKPLTGHVGGILGVCVVALPDGSRLLASAGGDGAVRLWDPASGQPVGEPLTGHEAGVRGVCAVALPDGTRLLASAGDDGAVRLWDPISGEAVGEPPLTGHEGWVRGVCAVALPDGTRLLASAGDDGAVRLWDPISGEAVGEPLTGHEGWVRGVCAVALPDGTRLLASAGDDGTVRLWDPISGEAVGEPLGHEGGVRGVCAVALPDGTRLLASAGADGAVRLWDPISGQPVGEPLGHEGGVRGVCAVALPDGVGTELLASAGGDGTVRLWDPISGQPVGEPLGHEGWVNGVCAVALPDEVGTELLASAGDDGTVRLWNPISGEAVGEPLTGHHGWVRGVCAVALPDGTRLLASAGDDGTVRLWDPTSGQAIGEPLTGHEADVRGVCPVALPNGPRLLASAGADGTVRLWDPTIGQPVGEPLIHQGGVRGVCAVALPDGTGTELLASAGDDGTVRLWHPTSGQPVGEPLTGHDGRVRGVCTVALPDGTGTELLASAGDDGTVRLWDPTSGQPVGEPLTGHDGRVRGVCTVALPDGTGTELLASAGDDGTVRLWDPTIGQPVGEPLTGHEGGVLEVCPVALPDGTRLLASAGDDRTILLWELSPFLCCYPTM